MKIVLTPHFRRSFKRLVSRNEKMKQVVRDHLKQFEKNPQDQRLKDHALVGKFNGYRAFSMGYDLRAIYQKKGEVYIFFDIGTHDQIYS